MKFRPVQMLVTLCALILSVPCSGGQSPDPKTSSVLAKGAGESSQKIKTQQPTVTILYSFKGYPGDGARPQSRLIRDSAGNFYGTTANGGSSPKACGSAFRLDNRGTLVLLHSFETGTADGQYPWSGLIADKKGNLYGTTGYGGTSGCGTLFRLDPSGKLAVLHNFEDSPADGAHPNGGLLRDEKGNLYGTTAEGGAFGEGAIFRLDRKAKLFLLHSFRGMDGKRPLSELISDSKGNLYGTTAYGGAFGFGTVFKINAGGSFGLLHSFKSGPADGERPISGLIMDNKRNLYGTTGYGGASGAGTVFRLDTHGKVKLLHAFTGLDGKYPVAALVMDERGDLYGTTSSGGPFGFGTLFSVNNTGRFTVLHGFSGKTTDGAYPIGGLLMDHGSFYGTTHNGGSADWGTVFKFTLSKREPAIGRR